MRKTFSALTLLILIAYTPLAVGQEYYSPNELSFTVYDDGYVVVDYTVDVDPTMVRVKRLSEALRDARRAPCKRANLSFPVFLDRSTSTSSEKRADPLPLPNW